MREQMQFIFNSIPANQEHHTIQLSIVSTCDIDILLGVERAALPGGIAEGPQLHR